MFIDCTDLEYLVEDCEVTVELADGREFDVYLEDETVGYYGWQYRLIDALHTLYDIVTALWDEGVEIETEDISRISYDCNTLYEI